MAAVLPLEVSLLKSVAIRKIPRSEVLLDGPIEHRSLTCNIARNIISGWRHTFWTPM